MSIQEKAMLVNLTIRAWSARRRDKNVGKEVEANHQAKDAGNFNKLLIDKEALAPIVTLSGKLRDMHYAKTLPWGDNGDRMLPSKMYFEYLSDMNKLKEKFELVVQTFTDNYPAYKQNARKRLGTMYNPEDYPDVSRIKQKFEAHMSFLPIPDAADFRVDLDADEVAEIKKDIEKNVSGMLKGAVDDLWSRMHECVEKIRDRLSDPEAVFRDSLIENAKFICSVAEKLNINDDTDMEQIRREIEDKLCFAPAQRLRDDKALRAQVAENASHILQSLGKHAKPD